MGLLNKKPVKKTTINKLIQESKESEKTIEEIKQEKPQTYAESVYEQFKNKFNIIKQQKEIVYQNFRKEFEDFVAYLDPIRDKDIVDQLDELRNYQKTVDTYQDETEQIKNEIPKTYDEEWKGEQVTVGTTTEQNILNPYAIYYEDYIQQEKIRENLITEYDVMTKQNISNDKQTGYYGNKIDNESSDGKQTIENLKQSFQPDFTRCVDNISWTERFMWQLIMGEHKNTDLVYWLNKYVLGIQETLLNNLISSLRGIRLKFGFTAFGKFRGFDWTPFDFLQYFDFAEQFQYNSQNVYKNKVCKTPYFPKNYTGSSEGMKKFLKKKNNALARMVFSSSGSNIPSIFKTSFYKKKMKENEQIYNTLIAHYLQEGFNHKILDSQSKLVKYKNKQSISIPEDMIIAQGEQNLQGILNDDYTKLNQFLRKFFKIPGNMYLPDQSIKDETKHIIEQITLFRQQTQEFYPLKPEFSSLGEKFLYRMVKGNRNRNQYKVVGEDNKPKYDSELNSYTKRTLLEPQKKIEEKYRLDATKNEQNRKHFLARDTQNMAYKIFEGLLR